MTDHTTRGSAAAGATVSRRTIASAVAMVGAAAALPAATAGAADRLAEQPGAPGFEYAFEEKVLLGPLQKVGPTPYGKRLRIPITGGSFSGPRIHGRVLSGGADWQLIRNDSCVVIDADYMIEAHDGALIHVRNKGIVVPPKKGRSGGYFRAAPTFEAPLGPYEWLNQSLFVSTIQPVRIDEKSGVVIRIYRIT